MRRILLAGAALLVAAQSHLLAADMPDGVHARSPDLCERAKASGPAAVAEDGELLLTARGLDGLEFNCRFVRIDGRGDLPGWVATALCEEPGWAYPDVFSIMPRGEGQLEVVSLNDGEKENTIGGLYTLCPGVKLE